MELKQQQQRQEAVGETRYRQLPCKTFISVGTCPYRERCVYLHDPRCLCKNAKSKSRKKNKDDTAVDSLFWPFVSHLDTQNRRKDSGNTYTIQIYQVPPPSSNSLHSYHDEAMYSMWNTFIDCCLAISNKDSSLSSLSFSPSTSPIPFEVDDFSSYEVNKYSGRKRLDIFMQLANSNEPQDTSKYVPLAVPYAHDEHEEEGEETNATGGLQLAGAKIVVNTTGDNKISPCTTVFATNLNDSCTESELFGYYYDDSCTIGKIGNNCIKVKNNSQEPERSSSVTDDINSFIDTKQHMSSKKSKSFMPLQSSIETPFQCQCHTNYPVPISSSNSSREFSPKKNTYSTTGITLNTTKSDK